MKRHKHALQTSIHLVLYQAAIDLKPIAPISYAVDTLIVSYRAYVIGYVHKSKGRYWYWEAVDAPTVWEQPYASRNSCIMAMVDAYLSNGFSLHPGAKKIDTECERWHYEDVERR